VKRTYGCFAHYVRMFLMRSS